MNNNLKLQEAKDKIAEGFKNMTVEDYLTKVLCLNGSMTEELFDRVMHEVLDRGILDDESIGYYEEDYLITNQEFLDVFHYIDKAVPSEITEAEFEYYVGLFNYKGHSFEWGLMLGQGSSCSIRTLNPGNTTIPELKIDPEIKFYKRLESEQREMSNE